MMQFSKTPANSQRIKKVSIHDNISEGLASSLQISEHRLENTSAQSGVSLWLVAAASQRANWGQPPLKSDGVTTVASHCVAQLHCEGINAAGGTSCPQQHCHHLVASIHAAATWNENVLVAPRGARTAAEKLWQRQVHALRPSETYRNQSIDSYLKVSWIRID